MAIIDVSHEKFKAPTHKLNEHANPNVNPNVNPYASHWTISPRSVQTHSAKSKKPGRNEAKAVQKLRVWVTAAFSRFISGLSNLQAQWDHTHTHIVHTRNAKKKKKGKEWNQTEFGSKKRLRYLLVFSKRGTYHRTRRLLRAEGGLIG